MRVIIDHKKWYSKGDVSVRGCCWNENGNILEKESLADKFKNVSSEEEILDILKGLNGLYSIIINKEQIQAIAIDKTRIYPLYYRQESNDIIVSDLPQKILKKGDKFDQTARKEYLSTGAPLQGKTLVEGIFQLKPANLKVYNNGKIIEKEIYSHTVKKEEVIKSELTSRKKALKEIFDNVFDRLVKSLKNRQVIIPLSGGYDSRLILCMLKKRGYQNIICYTIGPDLIYEQNVAVETANRLGVKIYHVDYRKAEYVTQKYGSEEFYSMVDYVGAFGNFLWLFEYNAIKWLENKRIIDKDAVFIPGHCGDFIGGSHLDKLGIKEFENSNNAVLKILINSFEYNRPLLNKPLRQEVKEYINKHIKEESLCYSAVLDFILKNRLAHQINNSSRVYDYMNYDVRFPFWDNELTEFFRTTEYKILSHKKLYDEAVCDIFRDMDLIFDVKGKEERSFNKQYIINFIKQFTSREFYIKHKGAIDKLGESELTKEMVNELVNCKIMKDEKDYLSQNEIMLKWYLKRVEDILVKKI